MLDVLPVSARVADGELGGVRASELAAAHGTPLLVFGQPAAPARRRPLHRARREPRRRGGRAPVRGHPTLAMGSNHNVVPRSPGVLVAAGRSTLIRRRERLDDLLRLEA